MNNMKVEKLALRDKQVREFILKYEDEYKTINIKLKEKILNSKAHEIHDDICKNKIYTSTTVVLVYCFASLNANKITNALTEIMFEEALIISNTLDEFFSQFNKPIGPLHGIPFSIKDTFDIKHFDSTIGLVKYCFLPKQESSLLVQEIVKLGGIPFVKTNVPQTLMSFECSNPLWGLTSNPIDVSLSPGGSSGGEAALIASKGSIIGIGSDIGGSLRIPAHFSGIFSFKPSYNRLSNQGTTSYKPVHIAVEPVMGPMATCSADLRLFCEATFGHRAIDVMPLKYQNVNNINLIIFGYCKTYPFMQVSPACHRAVIETIDKLKADGQTVIEYEFPKSFDRLTSAFYEIMSADGWQFYFDKLEGEEREKHLQQLLKYAAMPNWIKSIVGWIAGLALKDKRASSIIRGISRKDVYQIHKIQVEIDAIIEEFSRSIESRGVDILIMPVHVLPATPNGSFGDIHFCAAHTFMWNLLNQPIGVMPVSKFDSIKDTIHGTWPRVFKFSDIFKNDLLDRAAQHWYNPNEIPELPLGIQVIGKSNEDERVLQAMSMIEKLLK